MVEEIRHEYQLRPQGSAGVLHIVAWFTTSLSLWGITAGRRFQRLHLNFPLGEDMNDVVLYAIWISENIASASELCKGEPGPGPVYVLFYTGPTLTCVYGLTTYSLESPR